MEVAGVSLNYEDSGERELKPLVIMHGWGCDHTTVASIARIFEGKMRVVNIDLPGHGSSSEPPEIWGVPEFTAMLEEFLGKLGIDRPSLVGHSFGGRVAILYASRNPVEKMMLVDAAGVKPRRSPKWYLKVYAFKAGKLLLPLLLGRKRGERAIEAWRGKGGSADYRNSSAVMRGVMSRSVNQDLCRFMPAIKAPTLLVWGEEDTATPMADARKMERLIPDAGLVSFPGCGHYSFLDNSVGFRAVASVFFAPLFPKEGQVAQIPGPDSRGVETSNSNQ